MRLRDKFPGLASAMAVVFSAAAARSQPPEDIGVDEWAQEYRYVAPESGSPRPGKWDNATAPYAIKPMQVSSPFSGCNRIAARTSAQTMKSELLLNIVMSRIDNYPGPMMMVLPSIEEQMNWNRTKWRPNLKVTPSVNEKVTPERSRDETASVANFKHFVGGYLIVATASSSKQLQARSVRDLFMDELSEFPEDVKGRGDPVTQARHRQDAWGDMAFECSVSTPKELPNCRITKMVERGTFEHYYIPCPSCGHYQRIEFEQFDTAAVQPTVTCAANGCVIEETQKPAFLRYGHEGEREGAEWLACFESDNEHNPAPPHHFPPEDLPRWLNRDTEGRQPSFHLWQVYSTLKSWSKIAAEWRAAQGDPAALKAFFQQVLALPFDGGGEAPDYEKLHARKDKRAMGGVPFNYWTLTGAADIQGDRIEWAVWAWGPGGSYLVKAGIIPGDPTKEGDECWRRLAEVRQLTFEGDNGHRFAIDLFGVDAGYASYNVYRFCNGRPATLALDGRGDRYMSPIGMPKRITKAPPRPGRKARPAALLYPVGTFGLKQQLYAGLKATLEGPDDDGRWGGGAVRFPEETTVDYLKQMTAEYVAPVKKPGGRVQLEWVKQPGRANEALDIWVYARALAVHLGVNAWTAEDWEKVAAQRGGAGKDGGGLEEMWTGAPRPQIETIRKPRRVRRTRGRIQ